MNNKIALFEQKEIRKIWYDNKWYFSVDDVIFILTESVNVPDYIKKLKKRDERLNQGWGQFVTLLSYQTTGGKQKIRFSDTKGILRIIQSIPSPKAEPFKLWLAEVGNDRIEEINDPELAFERAKIIYQRKGYDSSWTNRRIKGIASRLNLTDEWQLRGVHQKKDYAILTNEIYKHSFDMDAKELRNFKKIDDKINLRDSFDEVELVLTELAEVTAKEIHKANDSQGLDKLKVDVKEAGTVAKNARLDIESKTGKKVISEKNHFDIKKINR